MVKRFVKEYASHKKAEIMSYSADNYDFKFWLACNSYDGVTDEKELLSIYKEKRCNLIDYCVYQLERGCVTYDETMVNISNVGRR